MIKNKRTCKAIAFAPNNIQYFSQYSNKATLFLVDVHRISCSTLVSLAANTHLPT